MNNHFYVNVLQSLRAYPFESGMTHPVEAVLLDELRKNYSATLIEIEKLIKSEKNEAGDVIRVLSRFDLKDVPDGYYFVSLALDSKNIDIRDAGVTAIDHWKGNTGRLLLEAHSETEPYLRSYISKILEYWN